MRRYETVYILRPSLGEAEITNIIENTNKIITDDAGSIITLDRWGMRKFAYLIKKESQGYYILVDYAGTPAAVAELERKFRIDDSVLKYMTVKLADQISEEEISQATSDAAEKNAAAAAEAEEAETEKAPEAEEAKKTQE